MIQEINDKTTGSSRDTDQITPYFAQNDKQLISRNWLLPDKNYTINILCNVDLLTNIKTINTTPASELEWGKYKQQQEGIPKGFWMGMVWQQSIN